MCTAHSHSSVNDEISSTERRYRTATNWEQSIKRRDGAMWHSGLTVGLNSLTHLQVSRKVSNPQHIELMFDETELPIALA